MEVLVVLSAVALLMLAAYRGYSVILFAPVCAMLGVLVTDPASVPAMFSGVFMEKLVAFVKLYFPVFVLGAVFGKLIELSGFSQAIVKAVIQAVGPADRDRADAPAVPPGYLHDDGPGRLIGRTAGDRPVFHVRHRLAGKIKADGAACQQPVPRCTSRPQC